MIGTVARIFFWLLILGMAASIGAGCTSVNVQIRAQTGYELLSWRETLVRLRRAARSDECKAAGGSQGLQQLRMRRPKWI